MINPTMNINRLSTGTSIVSIPYDNGVITATDLRATDTRTFQYYNAQEKTSKSCMDEIYVSGAGASTGTDWCAYPVIAHLDKCLKYYYVSLNQIESPVDFLNLFNKFAIDYFKKIGYRVPGFAEIVFQCEFLINVNTKKLNFAFKTNMAGDSAMEASTNAHVGNVESKDILAIGSGGRYLVGALCQENSLKPLNTRPLAQCIELLKTAFVNTCGKDLASSVAEGLQITVFQNGGKTYDHRISGVVTNSK